MIYLGLKKCGETAEEMHKTGETLRDYMMEKLCENYNPTSITYTKKGKPIYKDIGFSVSHSGGAAAVAVNVGKAKKDINEDWQMFVGGEGFSVGVDIEPIDRKVNVSAIKNRFLSMKEREYVGEENIRFLEIWTKKESICKLTSEGVSAIEHLCTFESYSNICTETKRFFVDGREYVVSVSYYKTLD